MRSDVSGIRLDEFAKLEERRSCEDVTKKLSVSTVEHDF